MLLFELIKSAFSSIIANKTRSILTMLGIIIGVAAVISMVSIGEGAKQKIYTSFQNLGTKLIAISPGFSQGPVRSESSQNLKMDDVTEIKNKISNIDEIAPVCNSKAQVKYLNKNTYADILGITPEYYSTINFKVKSGRSIDPDDLKQLRRVCTIGSAASEELFGDAYPVGNIIKIKGINFEIVGLMEEKGQSGFQNPDMQILIPLYTLQKRLSGNDFLNLINVKVNDEKNITSVQSDIEELLRKRHKLQDAEENDFRIRNYAEILEQLNDMTKTFTYLLGGIASVSLLVGGIGIMNIMLVSVVERTREIGIRKAIGAKRSDILIQFLLESVIVSLTGGIFGILLGVSISKMIPSIGGFDTYITTNSILLAFTFSLSIGLFFGIYPANKAAKLNPIDALRYE